MHRLKTEIASGKYIDIEEVKMDTIPRKYFRSLTGLQDYTFTQAEKDLIVESVNNALANPLQMTPSQYTEAPAAQ